MDSNNGGTRKPHAVCVPYPTQGHVTPMMQFTKLLHSRGFHVTFVNTEYNHRRLLRSRGPNAVKGLPDFRFETIPDGLPPSDADATQDIPALCDSTRKNFLGPFKGLLAKIRSSSEVPPVTCIVTDGVMGFALKAAKELGIPGFTLWTTSACGLMGYLSYADLLKRGIVPFKDESYAADGTLERPIDWVPSMPNIRLKDLPTFLRVTDPEDIMFTFLGGEAQDCLNATAVIINTFDELETEVLEVLKSKFPRLYTAGPLSLLVRQLPDNKFKSHSASLWKEDHHCIEWLDTREPSSVLYVNYGSITTMTDQHLIEFAWGLANSGHPFLWILRPDVVGKENAIFLPEGFLQETKDRGLVASWCSQEKVLCHPSVGAFLSHCGWNSTLESICGGVPLMCWPFFAEQTTNARYACTKWGIGVEVNQDVKRHEIEALVKQVMEEKKGKEMMKNAPEWKRKALEATNVGGSSYNNFERFIEEALQIKPE